MESMLYRGHRFLGGIKDFGWPWDCVRRTSFWKTLHVKNGRKCDPSEGSREVWTTLTVTMTGSELNLDYQTIYDILTKELGMLSLGCCVITTFSVTLPSPWKSFDQKGVSSGSEPPILAWSASVWLPPFPETEIPTQRGLFWNCGHHPKGRDRPAECTSTWRLPALLPGVGTTSPAVCGFAREPIWRGWCWFLV
jgi:hypothetical protein